MTQRSTVTNPSPTRVRYGVLAALCVGAAIAYIQRNSIGVAEEAIREDLSLDKHSMGWVMSAFFLTYALLQLPTGWLGRVLGTRRALSGFVTIFSAAAGVFALAAGFPMLLTARLAMGASQSGIFPCSVNSIAHWMPPNRLSLSSGLLGSFMSVGGALGAMLMGVLLLNLGWRMSYAVLCLPGLLFAAWFYAWFRDAPQEHASVNRTEMELIGGAARSAVAGPGRDSMSISEPTPWRRILTNVPVLALCGQQVFRAVGYMFFASWFATYLRETRGVEDLEVGILNSLPLLAVVVGSPLGGTLADWVLGRTGSRRWSRQGVAAGSMLACFGLILVSYPVEDPWVAVLLISAGAFCAAFAGPCAYTATIDMGGRHVTMIFSLMNMAGNIGAFVFPILVPYLLNEDPEVSGSGNWDLVLFTFAGMYLLAALCWLAADPSVRIDEPLPRGSDDAHGE